MGCRTQRSASCWPGCRWATSWPGCWRGRLIGALGIGGVLAASLARDGARRGGPGARAALGSSSSRSRVLARHGRRRGGRRAERLAAARISRRATSTGCMPAGGSAPRWARRSPPRCSPPAQAGRRLCGGGGAARRLLTLAFLAHAPALGRGGAGAWPRLSRRCYRAALIPWCACRWRCSSSTPGWRPAPANGRRACWPRAAPAPPRPPPAQPVLRGLGRGRGSAGLRGGPDRPGPAAAPGPPRSPRWLPRASRSALPTAATLVLLAAMLAPVYPTLMARTPARLGAAGGAGIRVPGRRRDGRGCRAAGRDGRWSPISGDPARCQSCSCCSACCWPSWSGACRRAERLRNNLRLSGS